MSPSPQDKLRPDALRDYGDAWRAVMQLVRSGHSWSGYERNCAFLNCTLPAEGEATAPRFVDISAISGLDFPDDGRSVAVVDWDHDGDLDLWLRNRSAPRLRLMRNLCSDMTDDDRFISMRLIGTSCNRDAIGARAELVLKADISTGARHVRTVRAGDAFLSQSSGWLHFGLASDAAVDQLIVDWPGGERESFQGLSVGASFEIKQGTGKAVRLPRRDPVALKPEPYSTMPSSAAARIVLPGRVALPPIALRADNADEVLRFEDGDTPTLITFWTSSCPNCRRELTDFARHRSEFEDAQLDVLAICLDGLDASDEKRVGHTNDATEFLRGIDFPYRVARTNRETVELIQRFQNLLFGKYPGFVVPLSFLLDTEGQVVSIYRGSYSHETFVQDRALTDLDDVALRTLATPLRGRWITKPATRSQFAEFVGSRMVATDPATAREYFELASRAEQDPDRKRMLREQVKQLERYLQSGQPR